MNSERRKYHRTSLLLPLEVEGYACENGSFVERTETFNVSLLGASFRLSYPVVIDDILRLTLPMPQQMRLFDSDEPTYRIYSQVRRIRPRADGYLMVGVAFISKAPPDIDFIAHSMESNDEPGEEIHSGPQHPQHYATRPIDPEMAARFESQMARNNPQPEVPKSEIAIPAVTKAEIARPEIATSVPVQAESLKLDNFHLKHPTIAQGAITSSNERSSPRARLRVTLSIRGHDKYGRHFVEAIQTEDVSKHGFCFGITKHELEVKSIIDIVGFQGKFNAQGEVRHTTYNPAERRYRVGIRLLGEPSNWVVK